MHLPKFDSQNDSALLLALSDKYPKMRLQVSRMLLDAGANIHQRNPKGKTVFGALAGKHFDMTIKENKEYVSMIRRAAAVTVDDALVTKNLQENGYVVNGKERKKRCSFTIVLNKWHAFWALFNLCLIYYF